MDVVNIMSVTIYSKIINEILKNVEFDVYIYAIIGVVLIIKTATNSSLFCNYISDLTKKLFNENESSMELTTHQKIYTTNNGKLKRQFYSEYYHALIFFLENLSEKEMSKFVEVMKVNYNDTYEYESGKEYMLIPDCGYRTKIFTKYQKKYDIYIEVKRTKTFLEKSKDNKDLNEDDNIFFKFILIVNGKNNFNVLNDFMKELLVSYKKQKQKKVGQSLFEFMRSYRDDDRRDRQTMEYREFPFKSNKFLDQNIFFEGKREFTQFIDRFSEKDEVKDDIYEISGVTKKACILLSGPPGCGKSCIVKGILNRTKRDGIIVPWTRLKTCSEFCNLFRSQKINDVLFDLKNYVFIFEDFDANKSEILSQRKKEASELEQLLKNKKPNDLEIRDKKSEDDFGSKSLMNLISDMGKRHDDELTLECVLNTLDGIAELQDAIIIFTTNHLENIDPAFYRSGRVDYLLNMKLASKNIIKEMIQTYFKIDDINKYNEIFEKMNDYRISTADVQSICFEYSKDRLEECLEALVCKQMLIDDETQ